MEVDTERGTDPGIYGSDAVSQPAAIVMHYCYHASWIGEFRPEAGVVAVHSTE